jgi:hypothetical protein
MAHPPAQAAAQASERRKLTGRANRRKRRSAAPGATAAKGPLSPPSPEIKTTHRANKEAAFRRGRPKTRFRLQSRANGATSTRWRPKWRNERRGTGRFWRINFTLDPPWRAAHGSTVTASTVAALGKSDSSPDGATNQTSPVPAIVSGVITGSDKVLAFAGAGLFAKYQK